MRVAFGPRSTAPSWDWVGLGTARELERYFDVVIFDNFDSVPDVDIVMMVKIPAPARFVDCARTKGIRLVYAPIDRYFSHQEIADDAGFLGACDLVLLHSEALEPYVAPYCRRVGFVEHHSRYALATSEPFKRTGYILWLGACEHLPHLVKWLESHGPLADVRLLTNFDSNRARIAAHFRAHEIGVKLRFGDATVNGHKMRLWSEAAQEQMMRECKAAIDVKGEDFNQLTKPPTKAQQFVASDIPFGCNPRGAVASYFRRRGFDVADAADADRLLSEDYWLQTRSFARTLRDRLSLEAVGRCYRDAFETLIFEAAGGDRASAVSRAASATPGTRAADPAAEI